MKLKTCKIRKKRNSRRGL